jgi:FAD/FMN-containing dehydrogenase
MLHPPSSGTLNELKTVVGVGHWLDAPETIAPFVSDFRKLYRGATPLVLLPSDVHQVSKILRVCHRDAVAVVPHGGNTSYCGAATPDETGTQVVVAMRRLKSIRHLDATNYSMIAEAGCTLAEVQNAARQAQRLFPLSLGSEGSAQIGGNLSTNAGGTAVLRYGMMRDLVLGIEAVLADGRIMRSLKSLRKDNTGYDLKSLLIGAEGTLGIITAASLKLFPLPADLATALVGVLTPRAALSLLDQLRSAAGDQVTTFELLPRRAVELTVQHVPGVANPLDQGAPWYVLVELSSPNPRQELSDLLISELEAAADQGHAVDAHVATSLAQGQSMWKLRESVPEAQRRHGASLKHDVSVPVSAIPDLVDQGSELIARIVKGGEMIAYGHLGDGNLHFNVSQRPGADRVAFHAHAGELERAVFDLVESLDGSISAEHGIGRLKADEFAQRADPVELAAMRAIKRALDPKGILNPGKVLSHGEVAD